MSVEPRLEPVRPEHLEALFIQEQEIAGHHMAAFTRTPAPRDRESFQKHWDEILGNDAIHKKLITVDGRVAGYVVQFERLGEPEVAYRLGAAFWGQGIASAALRLFLREEPRRPLFARVAADNLGSRRVLEKSGFVLQDTERAYAEARGAEIDELVLRLDAPG